MNEQKTAQTPLGWEINVLYMMLQATAVLLEDIDQQLHQMGTSFRQDKKKCVKQYIRVLVQGRGFLEKFGLDQSCWEAVGEDSRKYTNIIADANEMIRVILLYVDRAHTENGYFDIVRFLKNMPENGLFPEKFIARFNFKHEWIPDKGDRVRTKNHGDGTIDLKLNDTYVINLDSGGQTVLREEHFQLI